MIDNLALGLTHGLMMLAAWRLLTRRDLDDAGAAAPAPPPVPTPPPVRAARGWAEETSHDA